MHLCSAVCLARLFLGDSMNKSLKKEWVKNLRSGDYEQTKDDLCTQEDGDYPRFCCLGVLYDIAVDDNWVRDDYRWVPAMNDDESGKLCNKRLAEIGLTEEQQGALTELNDDGCTFKYIADYIEENI